MKCRQKGKHLLSITATAALVAVILLTGACVTPMNPGQGTFMISVINTGNQAKIAAIISTPFLVDNLLIISPADVTVYLSDLIAAIGPLSESPLAEVPAASVPVHKTLETETFFTELYPGEQKVYHTVHPEGDIYLLLGKGKNGIRLYGIVGPVKN